MRPLTGWVVFGVLGLSTACFAQVFEIGGTGGVSLMRNNLLASVPSTTGGPSTDISLKDGFRLGFRMAFNTQRFFGHEVGYAYNRTQLDLAGQQYGMAAHQGFYDFLVYALPEGSKVRPFVAGGVQFTNFVPPGTSATQGGGSTKFGLNYGGGVKARVGHMFMVRFDFRQYHSPKPTWFLPAPTGWLRQIEASAGFGVVM